ncbi:MAG: YbjN domain-containing protein [Thermoleophilia bacterium]
MPSARKPHTPPDAPTVDIGNALRDLGLTVTVAGPREWHVALPSEARRSFGVVVRHAERTVRLVAFFMRTPDRNREEVFRSLLRRNLDQAHWRFAVDDHGDVYLLAATEVEGLDAARLDALLGQLIVIGDAAYDTVMRLGFEVA